MAFTFGSNTGMFGGRFAQLFNPGWVKPQSEDAQELRIQKQALQVLEPDSGAQIIDDSLYHSPTLAIEASFQSSAALINEYRAMAVDLDVDMAIDDIINAMITTDEDEPCISLNLDDVDGLSESTKNAIIEEFQIILDLLEMEETAYEKAKSWYVDGRQYYQVVVDDVNKKDGIQALIQLDPRAMKKIKEVTRRTDPESRIEVVDKVDEYYLYNPAWVVDMTGNAALGIPGGIAPHSLTGRIGAQQVLKIPTDAVSFVHSGLMSPEGNLVFSNLEKARKPLNNLRMMRDALVIYRITRAPERRAFYIDVGSLPKKAAAEYVTEYMNRHRTKVNYDPVSGKVSGNSYQQTMLEDFWLPRREGGRGTEIVQLEGGQHLGEIDDII
jgi:hypothetical protein